MFKTLVANSTFSLIPPWLLQPPTVNLELIQTTNKQNTPPEQNISCFNEIKDAYKHYEYIFTDGFKQQDIVGATAVTKHKTISQTLPSVSSIFTAKHFSFNLTL